MDGSDGDSEIHVMDADGGDDVQITNNVVDDEWPTWSPDGTQIAFTRGSAFSSNIWIGSSTGGSAVNLTDREKAYSDLDWSPDP